MMKAKGHKMAPHRNVVTTPLNTLRVIIDAKAVDFNPAVVPSDAPLTVSSDVTEWLPLECIIVNPSATPNGSFRGTLWTGPNATGINLGEYPYVFPPNDVGFSSRTALYGQNETAAVGPRTETTIYLYIMVANGSPLTCDVLLTGIDISGT